MKALKIIIPTLVAVIAVGIFVSKKNEKVGPTKTETEQSNNRERNILDFFGDYGTKYYVTTVTLKKDNQEANKGFIEKYG